MPVPGGPTSSTPLGMRPPSRVNFLGSRRKAMISSSSTFDSSTPATSSKVTRCWFSVSRRARDLPKLIALPPPACIWRMKKIQSPIMSRNGRYQISACCQSGDSRGGRASISIPWLLRSAIRLSVTAGA